MRWWLRQSSGQFGNDLGKVIAAYKALGFDDVIEVAYGADFTSKNESAEFVERMEEGAPFMTTSCCPAYVKTAKVHVPEIEKFVSNTGSPMFYAAEVLKKRYPDAVSVFVGRAWQSGLRRKTIRMSIMYWYLPTYSDV